MTTRMKKVMTRLLIAVLLMGAGALAVRSYRSLQGPELQPWHTFVPDELRADELDSADWQRLPRAGAGDLRQRPGQRHAAARARRARAVQPLLRGQPRLPAEVRAGLEPLAT